MSEILQGVGIDTLKRDLSLRFTLLLSVFVVLLLVSYAFSSSAISAKEYDNTLINIAGRQRMLIHRYTSEINRVLMWLSSSDFKMVLADKKKADLTEITFEKTLNAFFNGGEVVIDHKYLRVEDGDGDHASARGVITIPPIKNKEILKHLKHMEKDWQELKRISLLSLRSNAQSVSKNRYVHRLLNQATKSVMQMDHVVQLMQQDSEIKLRRLDTMLLTVTVIGLLLFLFIVYFVYSEIVLPLDSSVRALRNSKETLEKEKIRAEKANQAKSEFLSSMSHELRTPMNAILGFSQLLKLDSGLSKHQQDSLDEITKAGHHLLELINEVLDLAKIESGHVDLSIEAVKLSELVDDCFLLITPLASGMGITVSHQNIGDYFIRADRMRFKQVLINLLSNAIKYNRERGKVELNVSAIDETYLRITISDTGNGIAVERLEELFLPFNRLDAENSTIEGTGIGLTITRQLVEMMAGHIGVDSEPGVGSHFWVEIPLESPPLTDGQDVSNHANTAVPSTKQEQQHTILYIEDNPTNLKLVSQILANRQHINLITALEPELGLKLASDHHPELILLDINMPQMNGYQVLNILKSDEQLKHIPVIAVTAKAMAKDIAKGESAGFSDYLTKPLDISNFLSIIDSYLKQ